jgi:hypothetical protein
MIIPICLLIVGYFPTFSEKTKLENIFAVIFFIQIVGVLFNNFLSIYVFSRFFPDKTLSRLTRILLIISLVLDLGVLLTITGVEIQVIKDKELKDTRDVFHFIIIGLFGIITIYFLLMRVQIKKYLDRVSSKKKL